MYSTESFPRFALLYRRARIVIRQYGTGRKRGPVLVPTKTSSQPLAIPAKGCL